MMWILCFTYTMFCVLFTQSFVFYLYKVLCFTYTKFCVYAVQKAHKTANTLSNREKNFAKVQNIHCTNTRFAE